MDARANRVETPAEVVLAVPEIRDYHDINSEIVRHLDAGRRMIRLSGVSGQRLLAAGLDGPWKAAIEIDGDAGPELAAGLDGPGLSVICRGAAADGGASRMRAGRVLVLGGVGTAFGYSQAGGLAVAAGPAGRRAGLRQAGGDLVLLSDVGPLAGERQSGGRIIAIGDIIGPHAGRGRSGGRFIRLSQARSTEGDASGSEVDRAELSSLLKPFRPWLGAVLDRILAGVSSKDRAHEG